VREEPGTQGYLLTQDGTEHKVGDSLSQIGCFRCGICCARYRPKVTLKEMGRIARKLGMSIEAFMSTYVRAVPTKEAYILQNSADTCPFLRWDEKGAKAACSIHALRPKACRNWVPSLSRPECREGLAKLKAGGELLLPHDMYKSGKDIERLSATLSDREGI
jgi:Fe-S-cluster containining protein